MMSNNILDKEIASYKEVMDAMPVNNKKNKDKYLVYVDSLISDYLGYRDLFKREIECRVNEIRGKIDNNDYDKDLVLINDYVNKLSFLNDRNTSYEKSGLDKILDDILHFYNEKLDDVNINIKRAVEIFLMVGVRLGPSDFCFTPFLNNYMNTFFEVYNDNDIFLDSLRESFDKLYWQCPNLIFQVGLNLKFLYYKNQKKFDKYYKLKFNNIIKEEGANREEIILKYKKLSKDYNDNLIADIGIIVDGFFNKKFNINDFSDDKISGCYSQFGIDKDINISNIYELYDSLIEYKGFIEFKYIYDDVLNKYKEKSKYNNVFDNKLKSINKIEKDIISINRKIKFNSKFNIGTFKLDKLVLDVNKKLDELILLYKELDDDKFNQLVNKLDDDTSIYECLFIVFSYYKYLKKCIKINNDGIDSDGINMVIDKLRNFLFNPAINIISNIGIVENVDIPLVISDRYKLLGINVSSDDILNNIDGIIDSVFKIIVSDIIGKSKVSYDDILFLVKVKDLVD